MTPGWQPDLMDANYIVGLPTKTSRQGHWQIAVHHLVLAAERGGIIMLAEIAMK